MIIIAIASQRKARNGVSRQRIASYLQQHYPVSSGGRFNAALRSALNSGINSGIFKFGNTKHRFNLTDNGRNLHKGKTAKDKRNKTNENRKGQQKNNVRVKENNTADKSTQCDFHFTNDQQSESNTGDRVQFTLEEEDTDKIHIRSELKKLLDRAQTPFVRNRVQRLIEQMNDELVEDEVQIAIPIQNDEQSLVETGTSDEIARTTHHEMMFSDPNWRLSDDYKSDGDEQLEDKQNDSVAHVALRHHINQAKRSTDLVCMLSHSQYNRGLLEYIQLNDLQRFLISKVNELDVITARMAHCDALPINEVLPEDVMRHVLSFGHLNQNRTVCRQWNRLNRQNEEKTLRAMYNAVDDRNLESLGPEEQTWIIHPKRPALHALEIRRGYRGPVRSPSRVPKTGPIRLLLHQGHYYVFESKVQVQYIGLSLVHQKQYTMDLRIESWGRKQHLENLVVNVKDGKFRPMILDDTEYVFKQCSILVNTVGAWLSVGIRGILHIVHCVIRSPKSPITVYSSAREVVISDSSFINAPQCVRIADGDGSRAHGPRLPSSYRPTHFVKVRITNNQFHNTAFAHLMLNVDCVDERIRRMVDQCVLHGNVSTADRDRPWLSDCDANTLCIFDKAARASLRNPPPPSTTPSITPPPLPPYS